MNRSERRQNMNPARAEAQRKAQRRTTIIYATLAVLALVAIVGVGYAVRSTSVQNASDAPTQAQISVGQTAPTFAVSTTNGPFDLASNGGKPTLLELFATWCPHCQRETQILDALYSRDGTKVNFVAVSASQLGSDETTPESQADVIGFMQNFRVTYPIAFDPDLGVAKKYLQGGFPTIVLIGKTNKILAIGSGEIPGAQLQKALLAATADKAVDPTFGAATPAPAPKASAAGTSVPRQQ
jgi:thiol-disulfide isomerase/thioredoxin